MIKIKPARPIKRDCFVVLNGVGVVLYSTDNEVDMQEWFDINNRLPLAWSYTYGFWDKDGFYHEVEITESPRKI